MSVPPTSALAFGAALLFASSPVRASSLTTSTTAAAASPHDDAARRTPLAFDEALRRAEEAPALTSFAAGLREKARLDRDLTSLPANPELTVSPGLRFTRGASPDFEPQLSVLQPLSLAGFGSARRQAAASETDALSAELASLRQDHRLAAAHAWIALWAVEHELRTSAAELDLARELTRLTRRALVSGAATATDVQEALAYEAELELQTLRREGLRFERAHALAERAGLGPEVEPSAAGELPRHTLAGATLSAALSAVDRLPSVAAARLLADSERKREVELEAQHGLAGAVGVTVARDAPDSVLALADLRVVLPLFEHGARDRAVAGTRRARAEGAYRAEAQRAAQALAAVFHELHHSREEEELQATKVLPALRELARLRDREVRGGTATVVDLLRARRAALGAERDLLTASAGRAFAELRAQLIFEALAPGAGADR